jgi:hypothetical protein
MSPLGLLKGALTAVSPATGNVLAYSFLIVVAVFLLSGPAIAYFYYRKNKRERAMAQPSSA